MHDVFSNGAAAVLAAMLFATMALFIAAAIGIEILRATSSDEELHEMGVHL
jgi:hypothetical protein